MTDAAYYSIEDRNRDHEQLARDPTRGVVVRLTRDEVWQAAAIGIRRQSDNLFARAVRQTSAGYDASRSWQNHVEGALAERAVAKYCGEPWDGAIGRYRADDVAGLQVRYRGRLHYDMVIKPHDRDDRPFLLVLGSAPSYWIVGWIMGVDGKRPEWWRDPTGRVEPRYYVPQDALNDLGALPGYEHRWQIVLDWRAKRSR